MLHLLEFEELVGRYWHRWASATSSYPHHPQAAVHLDDIAPVLAVFFRAVGGRGAPRSVRLPPGNPATACVCASVWALIVK